MYVWQGRYQRERLNVLAETVSIHENDVSDELLRHELEEKFLYTSIEVIDAAIRGYLLTADGKLEIQAVEVLLKTDHNMQQRELVLDVVKAILNGSELMTEQQLHALLETVQEFSGSSRIRFNYDFFIEHFKANNELAFEEFYLWLLKGPLHWTSVLRTRRQVLRGFQNFLRQHLAKTIIIQSTLNRARKHAIKEYRIAHPALFACTHCDRSFGSQTSLNEHSAMCKAGMSEKYGIDPETLDIMMQVLSGDEGRKLQARRLMYSSELSNLDWRVDATRADPFRPHLADEVDVTLKNRACIITAHDTDPKAMSHQTRPPESKALKKQCLTRRGRPEQQYFEDVLFSLSMDLNSRIDMVICPQASMHADVKFIWRGFASDSIRILGEFNGWKPEDLSFDEVGVAAVVKKLGAGRYRYRFERDGVELIDPEASFVIEEGVTNNIILVVNPPVRSPANKAVNVVHRTRASEGGVRQVNVRNQALGDDGVWALSRLLHHAAAVTHLDISHNMVTDSGLNALSATIKRMEALQQLKLNGNSFGFHSIKSLCECISLSSSLTRLELSGNKLDNEGAFPLGLLLGHNSSLQVLYMDGCRIGDDGVAALGKGLEGNNHLEVLSVAENNIGADGAKALSASLHLNATLSCLHLACNPIGPVGTMWIGKMLLHNRALHTIDLSRCAMMEGRVVVGLNSLLSALTDKNKLITSVSLRSNCIDDTAAGWIAHTLSKNHTIVELNLEGNPIDACWFKPNIHITNAACTDLPSIRTSLNRNNKNAEMYRQHDISKQEKALVRKEDRLKLLLKRGSSLHFTREESNRLALFERSSSVSSDNDLSPEDDLGTWSGKGKWLRTDLKLEDEATLQRSHEAETASMALEQGYVGEKLEAYRSRLSSYMYTATTHVQHIRDEILAYISNDHADETGYRLAVISSIFSHFGGKESVVPTVNFRRVVDMLALPLSQTEETEALRQVVIKDTESIGLRNLVKYLKVNSQHLCHKHVARRWSKVLRLRMPLSRALNGPAVCLLLDTLLHKERLRLTVEYRSMAMREPPRFVCGGCLERFNSLEQLSKHKSKEQIRHKQMEQLEASRRMVLRQAQLKLTKSVFPCYYELSSRLSNSYCPQLKDSFGDEGKPVGVAMANCTVLVVDVIGDYMQLRHQGGLVWIKYREPLFAVLVPSFGKTPGFWKKVIIMEDSKQVLYRVNEVLPNSIALKVRLKPDMTAEVCGYLVKGMVVECWAVFGDWIHIRFEKFDAVWVLRSSADAELLLELPEPVQLKIGKLKNSPCIIDDKNILLKE